jgi:hypothetical protein
MFIDIYIEYATFYHGAFTLRGECYGVYVYIPDRVITVEGDGIGSCTQVRAIECSPASACLYRHWVMNAATKAMMLAMFIRRV